MVTPFRIRLLAAVLLLCMTACSNSEPLRIGFSGQLSGPKSDLGVQGRNGALMAIEEINSRGGIEGRKLELIAEDDLDTPEGARQADALLVSRKVLAIIGHMTSGQTLAAMPELVASGTILVSPTTATPALSDKADLFFRVITSNAQWAHGLADYTASAGRNQAYLVGDADNTGYTDTFLDAFEKHFKEQGGRIAGKTLYRSSQGMHPAALAQAIRTAKPNVLVACVSARDLAALVQELKPTKSGIAVCGPPWPSTSDLIMVGGRDVEGFEFISNYTEDNDYAPFNAFRERYAKRFGWKPGFAAAFAYEAVTVLAEALRRNEGKREGLERALVRGQTMEGVIGPFILDEAGDVRRPSFITRITDGHLKTVATTGK